MWDIVVSMKFRRKWPPVFYPHPLLPSPLSPTGQRLVTKDFT